MKKLTDMGFLEGEVETITMVDLRRQPGEVFAQAELGKTFIITRAGKPVVQLKKIPEPPVLLGAEVRKLGLADGSY